MPVHIPARAVDATRAASEFDLSLPLPLAAAAPLSQEWSRYSFERALAPHLPRLYRYAWTLSRDRRRADDLVQDALVKAWLGRDSYRGDGSFVGWLLTIVRNEHLEAVRREARRRGLWENAIERIRGVFGVEEGGDAAHAPANSPEAATLSQESESRALAALHAVREPFRSAVFLSDLEELSHEEAARVLGIPLGTLKSRHARGRAQLRAAWQHRQEASGRTP